MINLELVFIVALFFSIYSYTVFPVLLSILGKLFSNPWNKRDYTPAVSIIISAYNEEKDIQETNFGSQLPLCQNTLARQENRN